MFVAQYRSAVAATMRATFGVSLYHVGTAEIRWGEALELLAEAALDTGTYLAAAQHDLRYPAPMIDIVETRLVGALAGVEDMDELLPFAPRDETAPPPSPEEFRDESAAMLAAWGIVDPNLPAAVDRQAEIYENRTGGRRRG